MIESFTAIDFETATPQRWSVCQVGLVRVEKNKIVEKMSMLVQPPNNHYEDINMSFHGITPSDTKKKPTFNKIWKDIKPFITNQNVVAHNGFSVDFHCIDKSLTYYKMPIPSYNKHCTYRLFGKKLSELCRDHKIKLNHHDALSDAMACAKLFLIHLEKSK